LYLTTLRRIARSEEHSSAPSHQAHLYAVLDDAVSSSTVLPRAFVTFGNEVGLHICHKHRPYSRSFSAFAYSIPQTILDPHARLRLARRPHDAIADADDRSAPGAGEVASTLTPPRSRLSRAVCICADGLCSSPPSLGDIFAGPPNPPIPLCSWTLLIWVQVPTIREREMPFACTLLNRMREWGRPLSYRHRRSYASGKAL